MRRLEQLWARLPLGPLVRRAAMLGSGAAIGQLAVVGSTPLLSRIYSPAEFGVLAVFLAASGVSVVVAAFRYEQAILVADTDSEASAVAKAATVCVLITTMIAAVGALAGGEWLAEFTSTPDLTSVLWLLPLTVAAGGMYQVMVSWATRRGEFAKLSRSKAALGVSLAAGQLAFGITSDWVGGLVVGVALSWAFAIAVLAPAMRGLTWATDGEAWTAAVRYRRFPQLGMGSSLLNRSALEIPSVALAALYGPEVAGSFLLAVRVVATPARLITESAYQVYVNEASRLKRDAPSEMYTLFVRTLARLARLAVPAALLLATIGPWGFRLVLGSDWTAGSDQVRLLAPFLAALMVTQPVAGTLWLTERLDLQLVRELARVSLVLTAFGVAWLGGVGENTAIALYVLSMVAGYGLLLYLCRQVLLGAGRYRLAVVPDAA